GGARRPRRPQLPADLLRRPAVHGAGPAAEGPGPVVRLPTVDRGAVADGPLASRAGVPAAVAGCPDLPALAGLRPGDVRGGGLRPVARPRVGADGSHGDAADAALGPAAVGVRAGVRRGALPVAGAGVSGGSARTTGRDGPHSGGAVAPARE